MCTSVGPAVTSLLCQIMWRCGWLQDLHSQWLTEIHVHEQHMALGWQLQHHLTASHGTLLFAWSCDQPGVCTKPQTQHELRKEAGATHCHVLHSVVGKVLLEQFCTQVYILIHKLYSVSAEFRKAHFISHILIFMPKIVLKLSKWHLLCFTMQE